MLKIVCTRKILKKKKISEKNVNQKLQSEDQKFGISYQLAL